MAGRFPSWPVPLQNLPSASHPSRAILWERARSLKQFEALKKIIHHEPGNVTDLPRMIRPIALTERGVARAGSEILREDRPAGVITSGTMVPMWVMEGEGLESVMTDQHKLRPICLGYVDSRIEAEQPVRVEVRGKGLDSKVVPFHLRSDAPPYAPPHFVLPRAPYREPVMCRIRPIR